MNEEALKKIVTDMIIIMNTTLSRFEIMDNSEEKRALITTYIRTLYNNNFKGQAVRWGVSSAGRLLSRRLPQFDTGGLQRGGGRGPRGAPRGRAPAQQRGAGAVRGPSCRAARVEQAVPTAKTHFSQ